MSKKICRGILPVYEEWDFGVIVISAQCSVNLKFTHSLIKNDCEGINCFFFKVDLQKRSIHREINI